MRFLNIEDILQQEKVVELETQQKLGGFYKKAHEGIDLLIQLAYLIPKMPLEETDEYNYHTY